jgi:hypothetical protein
MPRGTAKVQARVMAWWMGGEEECAHCGQLYAYEIEFRCSECDSPTCPHCRTQHAKGHQVCPTCIDTPEESANG